MRNGSFVYNEINKIYLKFFIQPSWISHILCILWMLAAAAAAVKSFQSCLTLCDPIGGSPPGSAIPGILQARTLQWVAISFSNVWKWKVKVKLLSRVRLCATPWTAAHQAPPSMGFSKQEYWSGVPSPSPLWMLAVHIKVMSHTNRVFINQNIVLQHRKHLLQKQTLKTKTNNTWWKHIYRISLFFFYLKIVLHMIISSEILYARKILIPNSRLSWITHSLYVSNYASYPSLPDRSFKKNMPIPWIEVKKKIYHTEYVQFQQSSKYENKISESRSPTYYNQEKKIFVKLGSTKWNEKRVKSEVRQTWAFSWFSGKESTCQCRGHRFNPWEGKIP